ADVGEAGGVGGVGGRRRDGVGGGLSVAPRVEAVPPAVEVLVGGGQVALDADHAGEGGGTGDRLPVEGQRQAGGLRRDGDVHLERLHVAHDLHRLAGAVGGAQVEAVPDVGGHLAAHGDRDRAVAAGRFGLERMGVGVVVQHRPP